MKLTAAISFRTLIGSGIVSAAVVIAAGLSAASPDLPQPAAEEHAAKTHMEGSAHPAMTIPPRLSAWDKRWWIEKTSRLLRGGESLDPNDDIDHLAQLSKDDIAREFMSDERFGDTVLDFNMYVLGFKVDSLKVDGAYVANAYDFANAINSAKAVMQGGDYLKLFDLEGDDYMAPLAIAPSDDTLAPEDAKLTPQQLREKAVKELHSWLEDLLRMRQGAKPIQLPDYCDEVDEFTDARDKLTKRLNRAFADPEIFVLVRGGIPELIFDSLTAAVDQNCDKPEGQGDVTRLEAAVKTALAQFDRAFAEIFKFEPTIYGPDTVAEFRPVDRSAFPNSRKWLAFGFEQGTALANSSTNYNRKRAAYVLKRFFCDDLNPVGFDDPKEHVSGAHGSDTSCYACHYKLDPMAGFFRNYGALFSDEPSASDIVFDDLASVDRSKYLMAWRAPEGSARKWNIGYIRSPRWTEQNEYGQSVADLSRIIRNAPEAKRCVMKRLTQYMLGESQTVDGSYLDYLTANFEKEAAENSSTALKNAMIRILDSQAYQTRNPDPRQCYDFAPGTKRDDRPPCRIAYILEKNCVQCHSGKEILNTLDFTKWIDAPSGHGKAFPHLNSHGGQISTIETLQQMSNRLSSTDPKTRMPKNKPMSSQERQDLFLWVQSELARRRRS